MDEVVRLIFFVSIYLRVWGQKKLNFENSPGDMNQQKVLLQHRLINLLTMVIKPSQVIQPNSINIHSQSITELLTHNSARYYGQKYYPQR
jgi:hypothetical protein